MSGFREYDRQKTWREQDFQVSARLHIQHLIWSVQLGYVIHPKIELLDGGDGMRVADVACGNGAWLLDAARQIPNATFDGFDLTLNNAPAAAWLPKNVKFHSWDVFSAVPEQFVGVFDIVHIRAVYSLIINNQAEPLITNLMKMLKPGGHLQWDEADLPTFHRQIPPSTPSIPSQATTTLVSIFNTSMIRKNLLLPDWLHALPSTLEGNHACDIVAHDRIVPKREAQRMWCDNFLMLFWGIAGEMSEGDGREGGISREGFEALVGEAAGECEGGVWVCHESVVVVGRKKKEEEEEG